MTQTTTPAQVGSNDGLGLKPLALLVERLLKYSDIRRNDPRENREALRDLIVGELADELRAVRAAERERLAQRCEQVAAHETTMTAREIALYLAVVCRA